MPSNKDFKMSILVGGLELIEYEKDELVYVESNLATPVSYIQESEEVVQGEVEKQSQPVTPYEIKISAMHNTPKCQYRVYVDGQRVCAPVVEPGESRVCKGFRDGYDTKEFLFSLPRFPQDKEDRLDKKTAGRVGTIEVKCWNSLLLPSSRDSLDSSSRPSLDYKQANKKDNDNVTNGEYTMITTKAGRTIHTVQPAGRKGLNIWSWQRVDLRSKLTVRYMMGYSLIAMGFKLGPILSLRSNPEIDLWAGKGTLDENKDEEDDVIITEYIPAKKRNVFVPY